MNLSAGQVAELAREVAALAVGASVLDVLAAPPHTLVLELSRSAPDAARPARERLFLCAESDLPRFFWSRERWERPRAPLGPFAQRLQADVVEGQVARVEAHAGERVVSVWIDAGRCGERRCLRLELFLHHANLLLLDRAERILGVLHPTARAAKDAAAPRLEVGATWRAPRTAGRKSSPSPPDSAGAPATAAPLEPPLLELAQRASGAAEAETVAPLSVYVANVLGAQAEELARQRAKKDLAQRLERRAERARGLLAGLEKKRDAAQGASRERENGELLLAHLAQVRRGMRSVEVPDSYAQDQDARRKIELDPKLSPQKNAERCFERFKKLERSAQHVEAELGLAKDKLTRLESWLAALEAEDADPAPIEHAAVEAGLLEPLPATFQRERARETARPAPRLPYRAFEGGQGSVIWVGRSAADNDVLSIKLARGNDLWFHTADAPGSHVVLRVQKEKPPHPEDVLDAAHLALHFSPLRGAARARVHVAERKFVHKPRGAKPGLVTLSGGRVLDLRAEPARLARLLELARGAREEGPGKQRGEDG